ncbi:DinB family protein [Polluticoccus soli]|uniref:DinB family protein n=1 Tax=Polluticoccus soli TaxID=3034150 RepID=UPI0023E22BDD|nr:DinB family protein [Flavipsychrobacter sp. JY13-12]
MKHTATQLLNTMQQALPLLRTIADAEASIKPAPGKWSKKEIIGHLVDSAANNQQKFVRTIMHTEHDFPPYAQDEWVAVQRYNDASWQNILNLWEDYNIHLAHIIQHLPADALQHTISIGGKGPFTLEFIAQDYVEHLKHHLKAVLPEAEFLGNYFKNVY